MGEARHVREGSRDSLLLTYPHHVPPLVAYFSMEYGLHEEFHSYAGGLGVLAGDFMKSACDLGLSVVGIGLRWAQGYTVQRIGPDGYPYDTWRDFPPGPLRDTGLRVRVRVAAREVECCVWQVERYSIAPLYLLEPVDERDRWITRRLYDPAPDSRIAQEMLLGIGGIRALRALHLPVDLYHFNEGHAVFAGVELIADRIEAGADFQTAWQELRDKIVFTTHTPVPAGNDAFPREMMRRYFGGFAKELGLPFDELFSFGQTRVNQDDPFSMTILALRASRHANGVSKLHGAVSRSLWKDVWSGVPVEEVPITSITNGIHTKTWMAPEFSALYTKYLGDWEEHLTDAEFWRRVVEIPDAQLWETHQKLKLRLVEFVRERVRLRRTRVGESMEAVRRANQILDPEILTIGFARRFATYKRGALLFSDKERLARLLNDTTRPVQFIFAGKAHPRDEGGKALIKEVYKFSRQIGFENRIVFVEDYDTYIARRLVQGVDLWLNNPLRPLEASGTSGMKLPPNGGLNLSVLDGWWCESYNGKNGWAIGPEIEDGAVEFQSEEDASSLYQLLENQIIPLYYAKPDGKLPLAWLQLMRESIRSATPVFNTHRMVKEYAERLYRPAELAQEEFARDDCRAAVELSQWKAAIRKDWTQVHVSDVQIGNEDRHNILVGDALRVSAKVHLGGVDPQHVRVEAYYGEADNDQVRNPAVTPLYQSDQREADGNYLYHGSVPASESGMYGFSVRVVPTHPHLVQAHELRLITWS